MNKLKDKDIFSSMSKAEVIDEIKTYLNEQIELTQRECIDDEAFDVASWPYYQAKKMGMIKAYKKLLNYLPEK